MAGVRAEQTSRPGLLQPLVWSEHWGQGTGRCGSTDPERSQGWEALGGSPESIKDLCQPLPCPWSPPSLWPLPLGGPRHFSLPLPTSWTLSLVAVRADGGGFDGMGQGSCQRCGPGARADVCPGASLSLPRAEILGCMPFPLTQELASATHSHPLPRPQPHPHLARRQL